MVSDEDEKIVVTRERKTSDVYIEFCGLTLYSHLTLDSQWHHIVLSTRK